VIAEVLGRELFQRRRQELRRELARSGCVALRALGPADAVQQRAGQVRHLVESGRKVVPLVSRPVRMHRPGGDDLAADALELDALVFLDRVEQLKVGGLTEPVV
jgi:hypothetical protein